jgi:hypothetical protein
MISIIAPAQSPLVTQDRLLHLLPAAYAQRDIAAAAVSTAPLGIAVTQKMYSAHRIKAGAPVHQSVPLIACGRPATVRMTRSQLAASH